MAEEYNSSDADKTEEPTQHRIEEFRRRGEVASSRELTNVLILTASLLSLTFSSAYMYEVLSSFIEWLYFLDFSKAFEPKAFSKIIERSVSTALLCAAPVFVATVCIGVISNIAQIGLLYAPDVLNLKWERINPVLGLRKLFTIRVLVEALNGFLKFLFIFSIAYFFMQDELSKFTGYLHMDFSQGMSYGKGVLVKMIFFVIVGLFIVAAIDFSYQKFTYQKRLRMTKDEAKRERREQEGSPEIKQRIKTIQKEMSQKRMMQDIPKADVVVTNPIHVSVALKYDIKTMSSPQVVAKGVDFLALKIREIAKSHDVPLVENVPLARNLYKNVKLGAYIPRDLYKAVAEVLTFVYKIKKKNIKMENMLNE